GRSGDIRTAARMPWPLRTGGSSVWRTEIRTALNWRVHRARISTPSAIRGTVTIVMMGGWEIGFSTARGTAPPARKRDRRWSEAGGGPPSRDCHAPQLATHAACRFQTLSDSHFRETQNENEQSVGRLGFGRR